LDHAGEEANAEVYRDLLHEIDRAFQGYERSAVRHGWLADRALNAGAAQIDAARAARRRGDALVGHVDLAAFVTAAIAAETGGTCARTDVLPLPAGWATGLDDLPGYDAVTRTLRITRKRSRLRDRHGRSLAFLGRAHPVVRRATASVRRIDGAACDNRVGAARTDSGASLALLLCFSAELHDGCGSVMQRVIAVLVPESGAAVEVPQPQAWLALAGTDRAIPPADVWHNLFAAWAPQRQAEAEAVATAAMQRMATQCAAVRQNASDRAAAELERWLRLRADAICGAFVPRTADLFGAPPAGAAWQLLAAPLDRLAAFALDSGNPPALRREADSVVALFRRRADGRAAHAKLSAPMLLPAGMLMLVPPGCGA
jgi:hypothetical protein